jgi:hypothetical protein
MTNRLAEASRRVTTAAAELRAAEDEWRSANEGAEGLDATAGVNLPNSESRLSETAAVASEPTTRRVRSRADWKEFFDRHPDFEDTRLKVIDAARGARYLGLGPNAHPELRALHEALCALDLSDPATCTHVWEGRHGAWEICSKCGVRHDEIAAKDGDDDHK